VSALYRGKRKEERGERREGRGERGEERGLPLVSALYRGAP